MPRYDFVLFDADNTLFDFDRSEHEALRLTLEAHHIPFTPQTEACYLEINRGLWAQFDRGEVSQSFLVVERFAAFLRAMGRTGDPEELNRFYLERLGEQSFLLPGAEALCRALAPVCTLAVLTNGVARAQRGRFLRSPLAGLVPYLFISEEVGAAKPSLSFFRPVFAALGITQPQRALMVGDNLNTDIQGGRDAGADTAWFNPRHLPCTAACRPTWEVDGFPALQALILDGLPPIPAVKNEVS